jgi:hypothetical protein
VKVGDGDGVWVGITVEITTLTISSRVVAPPWLELTDATDTATAMATMQTGMNAALTSSAIN